MTRPQGVAPYGPRPKASGFSVARAQPISNSLSFHLLAKGVDIRKERWYNINK
jgi:hypothetical protein